MARADRLSRLDERRAQLEEDYAAALIAALQVTAAGKWGLFDHRQDRHDRKAAAPLVDELCEMGGEIDAMRAQLFMEPFALHAEFDASRGPVAATAPGEPKQALAWLARLKPPTA
ncbi:MAG: hypothetical protein ABI673_01235 [Novosphingobium sp.]